MVGGEPTLTTEGSVGAFPSKIPMIDVVTVGAGGGSVAWLSPEMWAELFLENKDNLLHELDMFMTHLGEYRDAMARDDLPALTRLLDEGRRRKEEVDGR